MREEGTFVRLGHAACVGVRRVEQSLAHCRAARVEVRRVQRHGAGAGARSARGERFTKAEKAVCAGGARCEARPRRRPHSAQPHRTARARGRWGGLGGGGRLGEAADGGAGRPLRCSASGAAWVPRGCGRGCGVVMGVGVVAAMAPRRVAVLAALVLVATLAALVNASAAASPSPAPPLPAYVAIFLDQESHV